ncbi:MULTISPECIES: DUF4145 domain-containing protein [unclassified Pseudovibrio]|uniref:DUF4145 domain-containing protein n=1 Tax=unclassified Pseudovibrio TaxID=2627060 RepID=UPI0007AED0BE|nr:MULTISPECIES: DUF4145 domain-containing protein [unclassified Pseudovibrio]KZL00435.1 hypothetical protein PsW74_02860 [Pseudovibrio sp. W74]KZL07435.1 hypothetical protein PsAD14_03820 [Pseudovibrio sp. Ad14]
MSESIIKTKIKIEHDIQEALYLDCLNCRTRTRHNILAQVNQSGAEIVEQKFSVEWSSKNQTIMCAGCETISFRQLSSHSEDCDIDQNGNYTPIEEETRFPRIINDLENERFSPLHEHYIPQRVFLIYKETVGAQAAKHYVLAGVGIRAITETICQDQKAKGRNLQLKIDDLVTKQLLTANDAKTLQAIREIGNKSAHQMTPPTAQQISVALEVIKHQMLSLYVHPKVSQILHEKQARKPVSSS